MSCSTSAKAGFGGSISGAVGSEVREWSVDLTQDLIDVTSFDSDGWRAFIPGLKGATGTYTGVGTTLPAVGSVANATFNISDGNAFATGDILVSQVGVVCQVEDAVVYTASFSFCGAVS